LSRPSAVLTWDLGRRWLSQDFHMWMFIQCEMGQCNSVIWYVKLLGWNTKTYH
jgi:hypothetical protein